LKQSAEVKSLQKNIVDDEKAAEKMRRDEQEHSERIDGIVEDISQLADTEKELDKSAREAKDNCGVELDESKKIEVITNIDILLLLLLLLLLLSSLNALTHRVLLLFTPSYVVREDKVGGAAHDSGRSLAVRVPDAPAALRRELSGADRE